MLLKLNRMGLDRMECVYVCVGGLCVEMGCPPGMNSLSSVSQDMMERMDVMGIACYKEHTWCSDRLAR